MRRLPPSSSADVSHFSDLQPFTALDTRCSPRCARLDQFVCDVFVSFFLPYRAPHKQGGMLIYDNKRIAMAYLKGWVSALADRFEPVHAPPLLICFSTLRPSDLAVCSGRLHLHPI